MDRGGHCSAASSVGCSAGCCSPSSRRRSGSITSLPASPSTSSPRASPGSCPTSLFVGEQGGSLTNSPGVTGDIGEFTMPFLSGGPFFGQRHAGRPRSHRRVELVRRVRRRRHAQGPHGGSPLRRARRRRAVRAPPCSCCGTPASGCACARPGEHPSAADSLGVRVHALPLHRGVDLRGARRPRRGDARHLRRPLQRRARRSARGSSASPRWSSATGGPSASPSAPRSSASSTGSPNG